MIAISSNVYKNYKPKVGPTTGPPGGGINEKSLIYIRNGIPINHQLTKKHKKIHFGKIDLILEHMSAVKSIKGEFIVQLSV